MNVTSLTAVSPMLARPAATAGPIVTPNPQRPMSMATFNVGNLFDTVDNPNRADKVLTPEEYQTKLDKLSLALREEMKSPDVIGFQEVENERVLRDLFDRPEMRELGYRVVMRDGNDGRGINNALAYRKDYVHVSKVAQLDNPVVDLGDGGDGMDRSRLFARVPLLVNATYNPLGNGTGTGGLTEARSGASRVTFIVNHFKSKLGRPGRFDARRAAQGDYVGKYVDSIVAKRPNARVVVMGDFNANDNEGAMQRLKIGADNGVRLIDVDEYIPVEDRFTEIYRGQRNIFDHILVTPNLVPGVRKTRIPHFNAGMPPSLSKDPTIAEGVSDHDPMLTQISFGKAKPLGTPPAGA